MSLPSQNSRAVCGLPARSFTGAGVSGGGSEGAQRGGGGVWRRCNFQISKIVDSSFNLRMALLNARSLPN